MTKDKEEKEFINPIDPDKITENPGTLPYAHTVGGAVIKPTKQGVIKGKSLEAMQQQTDMQLGQIREQIELLARQAENIKQRQQLSQIVYEAKMSFKPDIGHTYHLYLNDKDQYVLSMIGPEEWGRKMSFKQFVNSVTLLADHTWEIAED